MISSECQLEELLIEKLRDLKYLYRADVRDRATLENNFREKFEAPNRVTLADGEFDKLLDEIITPDVFTASRTLSDINSFTRDDGTALNYTLVKIKDWCKTGCEFVGVEGGGRDVASDSVGAREAANVLSGGFTVHHLALLNRRTRLRPVATVEAFYRWGPHTAVARCFAASARLCLDEITIALATPPGGRRALGGGKLIGGSR